jgi:signal transduction histidine kinase
MSSHRHDLMRCCAGLGEGRRSGFANAVGRTMRKIRLAAPILELVPEPVSIEGLAELSEQEGHLRINFRSGDARCQLRMQRNIDVDRIAMFVLCLPKANPTVAYVLTAKTRTVFAAACSVAQQVQCEPRLQTKWVSFVKLLNFFVGPSVVSIRPIFQLFHSDRGIDSRFLSFVGPIKQCTKRLQELIRQPALLISHRASCERGEPASLQPVWPRDRVQSRRVRVAASCVCCHLKLYTTRWHSSECRDSESVVWGGRAERPAGTENPYREFESLSLRQIAQGTLLSAEIARIEGLGLEAENLYEESIRLAHDAEFVQIEAIASEHAARFYEARGIQTVVLAYLTRARDCYLRWGAEAKVRQLHQLYPQLEQNERRPGSTPTIEAPIEQLDLATVLKVSEAVSGEMVVETLIDTLLRTAIEHAGAERGLLILPRSSELRIQAEATTSGTSILVDLCDEPISGAEMSKSVLLFAARMRENVILGDASMRSQFAEDPYIRRKRARSILTLPLMKHGRLIALLYLENNLAPHVFTPARVAVLKFLASEAATSLDNARLYRERTRAESEARESEQRYREAQLELAHANRVAVTGQLTASIAHEVNQPTTAVVASAEAALRWLERQPPELEATRHALARVVQNGIRASEVIARIRDLIKKKPPKRNRLAINAVMREVIELTQAEAARNHVSVRTTFADVLPDIMGDRVELQQVAVNLILNAIEAMSETTQCERELLIRTADDDRDGVLVAIVDSGPGLSRERLDRVFEPFYSTKSGGLGIGLSICRSIIEANGGRLWASPNEPRGAVFQFTIPCVYGDLSD